MLCAVFLLIGSAAADAGEAPRSLRLADTMPLGTMLSSLATEHDAAPMTMISFGGSSPLSMDDGSQMGLTFSLGPQSSIMDISDFNSMFGGLTSNAGGMPQGMPSSADGVASAIDPFMQSIISLMDPQMAASLLPRDATNAMRGPCDSDLKELCSGTNEREKFRSPLHCLGAHADKVSDKCKKDVKHSLPYRCASEISNGCDGITESIMECLPQKKLGEDCQNALDVTRGVIHDVNTAPTTLLQLEKLNKTHINASQTVKAKETPMSWKCPVGFKEDAGSLGVGSHSCCSATRSVIHPSMACASRGGRWQLASHDSLHQGMRCCSVEGHVSSETLAAPVPMPLIPGITVAHENHLTLDQSPFAMQSPAESSGRSVICLVAIVMLIFIGTQVTKAVVHGPTHKQTRQVSLLAGALGLTQRRTSIPQKNGPMLVFEEDDDGSTIL